MFSATLLTVSTWAQPVKANPDEVSEQQRRIQEERNQDLRKRLEPSVDVRTGPDTTVSSTKISDGESPCFLLHTIELALPAAPGTAKASAQEAFHRFGWVLREIDKAAPMGPPDSAIGRCIGLEGVSLLSKRAQNFVQANGFGAESMKRESNAESSSPFSFNNCPTSDKGGCSYGPLQIAANTGMMNDFIEGLRKNPSDEAQNFYKELQAAGGVIASQNKDPAFLQTWMKLTAKDPQFVQYQIDALVNQNLYPVVEELQKIGIDFNTLNSSQKEAIFSAAVQHGAGKDSKTKGADNVMERAISIAQTDAQAPSFPTYTRQELVYGQVEDQMRKAEETQNKLGKQEKSLITQEKSLITQQLNLERQKNQLLEQGMGAGSEEVQRIQTQVKALDKKISAITEQVNPITTKVEEIKTQINAQDQYIQEAAQYLKSQAQGSFADGEQWLKDFYAQRTQMYPAEAARYKKELDSLLKQYREEQKAKQKK